MGTKIVAIPSFPVYIVLTMLVRILLFLSTLTSFMTIVNGHCCGHCVPGLCTCAGQPAGCSDSPSCPPSVRSFLSNFSCKLWLFFSSPICAFFDHQNSHLCCAPQKCGDCNMFCCECSCCCDRTDGSNEIPALQKWKSMDTNTDLKVDLDELSLYLGNGTSAWTKHTYFHTKLTKLFMDAADSNGNGYIDPWEVDSELRYLVGSEEL